jgi:hypothetical protein
MNFYSNFNFNLMIDFVTINYLFDSIKYYNFINDPPNRLIGHNFITIILTISIIIARVIFIIIK